MAVQIVEGSDSSDLHHFTLENGRERIVKSGSSLPKRLKGDTLLHIPSQHYVPGLDGQMIFISGTYDQWKHNLKVAKRDSSRDMTSVLKRISYFLPDIESVYATKDTEETFGSIWADFMADCSIIICHEKLKGEKKIIMLPELQTW
jgi:hypothetical protein